MHPHSPNVGGSSTSGSARSTQQCHRVSIQSEIVLTLHAAERIEPLAERLADVLRVAPADPMASELVAVPSAGMRRWLQLDLARHLGSSGPGHSDGVAANIEMAFPGSLRLRVLEAGRDPADPDPWRVERLAWAVLDVAVLHAGDARLMAVTDLPTGASRYGRCRRIADLFDRYHIHRPDMIRSWAAGNDLDGSARPIPEHHRWQPVLWRLVRGRVGSPSPPERLPGLLDRLRSGDLAVALPDRVILFGLSLLPGGQGFLELIDAIGATRDVQLFLLDASPAMAAGIRSGLTPVPGARPRSEDRTAGLVAHPLLRSWGRLHRETTVLLTDAERRGLPSVGRVVDRRSAPASAPARASAPASVPASGRVPGPVCSRSVLARLQADIRTDSAPAGDHLPEVGDRSVQFHACHGATRQVEVLRDALLHALAEDPTLNEDDILVVCPALERFAPLIEAVFGASAEQPDGAPPAPPAASSPLVSGVDRSRAPGLRYRIADRSIRSANPVLGATAALLELVSGRFDAPAVLNFLAIGPLRERYRFTDGHLARISEWVAETNVSWGIDAGHRVPLGLPAELTSNTWRSAIDRLMLGAAITDDGRALTIGDVVPLGVEGDDAVVAGRFADLLWHLARVASEAGIPRPVGEWIELLREWTETLFATTRDTAWQRESLLSLLADVADSATAGDQMSSSPLEFVDVRRLLADRLVGAPGRPDFFRGGVTISSMTPLRNIPHRVMCVLGLDQAAFGAASVDGDDLAAANPIVGDRDPRAEVRQSLLEVVLAAGDRLVVLRDGHDVRTNQEIHRAVAVAELRDAVVGIVDPTEQEAFARRLEITHPRQPFDELCFRPGAIDPDRPWGFDGGALAGALARRRRSDVVEPFLSARLEPDRSTVIELEDLHRFLKHPVRRFLEGRLGIRLPSSEDAVSGLFPVNLAALDLWRVGDRLLSARLDGVNVSEWERVERQLGTLPPAVLGDAKVAELVEIVDRLMGVAGEHGFRSGPGESHRVDVALGDGTRIVGSVLGRLDPATPGPARVQFTRAKPEHRVAAWLDLMALVAGDPTRPWRAVAVNRGAGQKKQPEIVDIVPTVPLAPPVRSGDLDPGGSAEGRRDAAIRALEVAVDCFRRGSSEPIPLFAKLSRAVHLGTQKSSDWLDFAGFAEGNEAPNTFVYGGFELDDLMSIPAEDDDPAGSGGRVERFARHLHQTIDDSIRDHDPAGEPQRASSETPGRSDAA